MNSTRGLITSVAAGLTAAGLLAFATYGPGAPEPLQAAQLPGGLGGARPPTELVKQFDKDGDKRLSSAERHAALAYVQAQGLNRRGRGFGNPTSGPIAAGPRVAKASVRALPASVPFYDLAAYRTIFFDFEDANWEDQLMAFKETDVEVPATMTVDGKVYKDVDIKFRGASSFMMVPEGRKHSLNVTLDTVNKSQVISGYNSLNLLNSHEDPTYLRSVLYLQAARDFIPAAKANFVRVVINDESWGVYSNVQQVDKAFLQEEFKTRDGGRWKVPGSPNGRGGLEYLGDDVSAYKRLYEIKSKDDPKSWAALINLTKVLNQTPANKLEAALSPIFDVDGAIRFLAVDNALVNNDGYWVRASDYNIYLDTGGRFHVIPHDTNETFATGAGRGGRPGGPGGPGAFGPRGGGGRGGMRGGDATLDPLVGLDDASKPLRSKLLAVPALRAKYLQYTREIATKWLDWNTLGPLVSRYQATIATDVRADTHKLDSAESFDAGVQDLKKFAEQRRALLLAYPRQ